MTAISATVDDKDVLNALRRLMRRGRDMEPAHRSIGRVLKTRIQLGYRTGTDPYGRPWAPLKSRAGSPLRDRGNLRDAWDYRASHSQVELLNNRTVSYKGDRFSLAAIHHFGAVIRPRPDGPGYLHFQIGGRDIFTKKSVIPARKQIPDEGLPAAWRDDVLRVVEEHFARG